MPRVFSPVVKVKQRRLRCGSCLSPPALTVAASSAQLGIHMIGPVSGPGRVGATGSAEDTVLHLVTFSFG